ncbi:MAG: nicotinate (nicotinamide) nucleotide adenylyltransferase [Clostridia bacterium]|nr:nicotinate (nicotinamide) nucleotide adenylyltransferase [Clostridia bacterium]
MRRIGFFGGTFDPPHKGHINAAVAACDILGLERLLLIPTYIPPHKTRDGNGATAAQRLEMTTIAAKADPRFLPDAREIERGGNSYTYDTVMSLKAEFPQSELWMVCGSDMLATLGKWYRAEDFLKEIKVAAAPRAEGELEDMRQTARLLEKNFSCEVRLLEIEPIEVSSTEIRRGGCLQALNEIAEYIQKHQLYVGK